jgi:hypothetical protein
VNRKKRNVMEKRMVEKKINLSKIMECNEWCSKKLKKMKEEEYGYDLNSVKNEIKINKREKKNIEKLNIRVEKCVYERNNLNGEEIKMYKKYIRKMKKVYDEIIVK